MSDLLNHINMDGEDRVIHPNEIEAGYAPSHNIWNDDTDEEWCQSRDAVDKKDIPLFGSKQKLSIHVPQIEYDEHGHIIRNQFVDYVMPKFVSTESTNVTFLQYSTSPYTYGLVAEDTKPTDFTNDESSEGVSLASSSSWKTIRTVTLEAGTWLVQCAVRFTHTSGAEVDSNGNLSYRGIGLTTSEDSGPAILFAQECAAAYKVFTNLTCFNLLRPTSQTTYYLNARQNSTVAVDAYPRIRCIRIL